jgi:hypothetical protein
MRIRRITILRGYRRGRGGSIRGKMERIEKGVRKLGDIGGVMRRIGREDGEGNGGYIGGKMGRMGT